MTRPADGGASLRRVAVGSGRLQWIGSVLIHGALLVATVPLATLWHEVVGHGATAIVLGGRIESVELLGYQLYPYFVQLGWHGRYGECDVSGVVPQSMPWVSLGGSMSTLALAIVATVVLFVRRWRGWWRAVLICVSFWWIDLATYLLPVWDLRRSILWGARYSEPYEAAVQLGWNGGLFVMGCSVGCGLLFVLATSRFLWEWQRGQREWEQLQSVPAMEGGAPPGARCLGCGYSLRGISSKRCPECARMFDPSDAGTFDLSTGVPLLRWRGLASPPGWPYVVLVVALTVTVVIARSVPGSDFGAMQAWLSGAGLVAPLLLLWIVVEWVVRLIASMLDRAGVRRSAAWAVLPAGAALMASTEWSHWPVRARFRLSQPAFEARAAERLAGGAPARAEWVGLFYVVDDALMRVDPLFVRFRVGDPMFRNHDEITYRPNDPRPGDRRRLAPGWYLE